MQGRDGHGRYGHRRLITVALTACIGVCLAVVMATSAAASGPYVWTPYNLSSEGGGLQPAGQPALIPDPQTGGEEAVTNSPSGSIYQFGGDGANGVSGDNVTNLANAPAASTGSPAPLKDPQDGDFLIFTDTTGGTLESYDRNPTSDVWTEYNISQDAGGQAIAGTPSATVDATTQQAAVAADSSNGDLIVLTRDNSSFVWTATDVTSATGQSISGDPEIFSNPDLGGISVFADSPSGHLLEFFQSNGSWTAGDITQAYGGQTIQGDPVGLLGQRVVFAEAPGGDLIQWQVSTSGVWTSTNLTTLAGGPEITSTPSPVTDPNGGIDVFAEGANQHLVEYSGSGSSWSATDLTSDDDGPTIESAPAATVSASTSNVVIYATSSAGNLVELERTAAPAPATTTTVVTQTVESTPTSSKGGTTKKGTKSEKALKISIPIAWRWNRTESELRYLTLGKLKTGEVLSIACKGTGKKHTTGCPYVRRSAKGIKAIKLLVKRTAKTRYGVGAVLTLTVTEPHLRPAVAYITIRSNRAPKHT